MTEVGAVGIRLEGMRQLRATLRRAGSDLSELKEINRAAAEVVAATGKSSAPRVSGRLAATVRASGTKTAGVVRAGRKKVPYANPIHWGWFRRHIPANPWLSSAARSTEPTWLPIYERHLEDIIDTIKGI